jgi:hypothetical protein
MSNVGGCGRVFKGGLTNHLSIFRGILLCRKAAVSGVLGKAVKPWFAIQYYSRLGQLDAATAETSGSQGTVTSGASIGWLIQ